MLENIAAEKFCSGHSDIMSRETIQKHIAEMKTRQEKVGSLIQKGKTLEEIKKEFSENESRLIESIFNEIKQ
jgi:sulfur transfer protein SufE